LVQQAAELLDGVVAGGSHGDGPIWEGGQPGERFKAGGGGGTASRAPVAWLLVGESVARSIELGVGGSPLR
jgi:hypothetical protein